ncbi:MAG: hypothetical protein KC657_34710 [Myxococcales bacterium]|nr:hypothetical protein [Myxococcales bacterium]
MRAFRAVAFAWVLLAGACAAFSSAPVEAPAADASTPDASAPQADGAGAADGSVGCAAYASKYCWDFAEIDPQARFDFANRSGAERVLRDTQIFLSSPASFFSEVKPNAAQSAARVGKSLGAPRDGTYRVGASINVEACEGSQNGRPTYLEIYCPTAGAVQATNLMRVEWAGQNRLAVGAYGRIDADGGRTNLGLEEIDFPDGRWGRIEVEVVVGMEGRVSAWYDGVPIRPLSGPTVCAGATEIQLLLGVQHRYVSPAASARCAVRFDDVTLDGPP